MDQSAHPSIHPHSAVSKFFSCHLVSTLWAPRLNLTWSVMVQFQNGFIGSEKGSMESKHKLKWQMENGLKVRALRLFTCAP